MAIAVGLYNLLKRAEPFTAVTAGCTISTPAGNLDLGVEQAQVAATIAAVGARRKLPERAIVIAYATAIQESKLSNLDYGDRDSVGVFQQRPSQGWGKPAQLMDPVYATNKFFSALVKVKNYRKLPLEEAAQAVQRSAAGYAYAAHESDAKILAAAFTGRVPKSVHCRFPPPKTTPTPVPKAQTDEARKQLRRALGDTSIVTQKRGWLVASWSVAHAQKYGLRRVGFNGAAWSADTPRSDEWKADPKAGDSAVELS